MTRLFYGARISMTIALLATMVSLLIGVTWGAVAGFLGGRVDNIMMRIVDVLYGLPFMFIVILLIVIVGRSTVNLFIALGAVQWLSMARVIRGQVISLKNREFIEAARAIGVSRVAIIFRHLIRNTIGPVIVYSTLLVPGVILLEAFLSFLGLGVQPPDPSWGNMITEGATKFQDYTWLILWPGGALATTLFAMNFLGDGIRDALDPQMQKH
jgi:oligopeptide transport system permease protein